MKTHTHSQGRRGRLARGFSLIEMVIATAILLIGLVGVAQLIPAAMSINQRSRLDSSSTVFAQSELDQMLSQPLFGTSFTDVNGFLCNLGNAGSPGTVFGSTVAFDASGRPLIVFTADKVDGYNLSYVDPNDPFGATYDVRWAVITTTTGSSVVSKRFILGVRQLGGSGFVPAVTLDAMVQR